MAEYGNPISGETPDLGVTPVPGATANLGTEVDSALDPTPTTPTTENAANVASGSDEGFDWEDTGETSFDWGSVFIGMASGFISHYTKNYDMPGKVIDNMAKNRKAYEQRMARLQQIQAEASSNKALMAQLSMIGGEGGVNEGARKMASMPPETLQKKLAEFKEVKDVEQMASLFEEQGFIDANAKKEILDRGFNLRQFQFFMQERGAADKEAADAKKTEDAVDLQRTQQLIDLGVKIAIEQGLEFDEGIRMAGEITKRVPYVTEDGRVVPRGEGEDNPDNVNLNIINAYTVGRETLNKEREVKSNSDAERVVSDLTTGEGATFSGVQSYYTSDSWKNTKTKQRKIINEGVLKDPIVTDVTSKIGLLADIAASMSPAWTGSEEERAAFMNSAEYKRLQSELGPEKLAYMMKHGEQLATMSGANTQLILSRLEGEGMPEDLVEKGLPMFGALISSPEARAESKALAFEEVNQRSTSLGALPIPRGIGVSSSQLGGILEKYSSADLKEGRHYQEVGKLLAEGIRTEATLEGQGGEGVDTMPEVNSALKLMGEAAWESWPSEVKDYIRDDIFPRNTFAEAEQSYKDSRDKTIEANELRKERDVANAEATKVLEGQANTALNSDEYWNAEGWLFGDNSWAGDQAGSHFISDIGHITHSAVASETGRPKPPATLERWARTFGHLINRASYADTNTPGWGGADKVDISTSRTGAFTAANFQGELIPERSRPEPVEAMRELVLLANNKDRVTELREFLTQDEYRDDPYARRILKRIDSNWFKALQSERLFKAAQKGVGYEGKDLAEYFDHETGRFNLPGTGTIEDRSTAAAESLRTVASNSARGFTLGSTVNDTKGTKDLRAGHRQEASESAVALHATKSPILVGSAKGMEAQVAAFDKHEEERELKSGMVYHVADQISKLGEAVTGGYSPAAAKAGEYITGDPWAPGAGVFEDPDEGNFETGVSSQQRAGYAQSYANALREGEKSLGTLENELVELFGTEGIVLSRARDASYHDQYGVMVASEAQKNLQFEGLSREDIAKWDGHFKNMMKMSSEDLLYLYEEVLPKNRMSEEEIVTLTSGGDKERLHNYRMARSIVIRLIAEELEQMGSRVAPERAGVPADADYE